MCIIPVFAAARAEDSFIPYSSVSSDASYASVYGRARRTRSRHTVLLIRLTETDVDYSIFKLRACQGIDKDSGPTTANVDYNWWCMANGSKFVIRVWFGFWESQEGRQTERPQTGSQPASHPANQSFRQPQASRPDRQAASQPVRQPAPRQVASQLGE